MKATKAETNHSDKAAGLQMILDGLQLYGISISVVDTATTPDNLLRYVLRTAISRLNGGSRRLLENERTSRVPEHRGEE